MWNLIYKQIIMNKINEQTKQKHRYREQIGGRQKRGDLGGWVSKVEEIQKYKLPVMKTVMGM